jgi:hypothetical protein
MKLPKLMSQSVAARCGIAFVLGLLPANVIANAIFSIDELSSVRSIFFHAAFAATMAIAEGILYSKSRLRATA